MSEEIFEDNPTPQSAIKPTPQTPPLDSMFEVLRNLPLEPPRPVMLPGLAFKNIAGRFLLLAFPFLLLFGGLFIMLPIVMLVAKETTQHSQSVKKQVTARVIQRESTATEPRHTGTPYTFLKYSFQAGGRIYTGNALAFQPSVFDSLAPGSPLKVTYDSRDPRKNSVLSQNASRPVTAADIGVMVLFFVLMTSFFIIAFLGPLTWPAVRLWWHVRQLVARGNLCNGHIEFARPHSPVNFPASTGGASHEVVYVFRDAKGTERQGRMFCDNSWLLGQLKVGTPVVVVYDPKNSARSAFLEPFVA